MPALDVLVAHSIVLLVSSEPEKRTHLLIVKIDEGSRFNAKQKDPSAPLFSFFGVWILCWWGKRVLSH